MNASEDKKGNAFVMRAFREAVSRSEESDTAFNAFDELFENLLALFAKRFKGKRLNHFIEHNNDEICRSGIRMLAEVFFLSGFRNGVVYKEKNGHKKERNNH